MEKKQKNKREEVIRFLKRQQIRDVNKLDSYKLSICHPSSTGVKRENSINKISKEA